MEKELVVAASINVKASIDKVWNALVRPKLIKQYMFGTEVICDWKVGSTITWKGVKEEKPYEGKGEILKVEPAKTLQYSHFSALSGVPDRPENYLILTYELSQQGNETVVRLSQENTENEKVLCHSKSMWQKMVGDLTGVLEKL